MKFLKSLRSESGASLIEVLVSLLVFATGLLGLTSAGITTADLDRAGWTDSRVWAAVHHQLDSLSTVGYDNLTAGEGTVLGFPVVWDVKGNDPKKIILVTMAPNSKGVVVPDTFVTYVANW